MTGHGGYGNLNSECEPCEKQNTITNFSRAELPDNPLEQSEGPSVSETDQNTDQLPAGTPEVDQPKTDTSSDSNSNPDPKSARKSGSNVSGKGLAGFALLISACALGLSGYIGWRAMGLEQSQPVLREGMDQLQTQMARQQARLGTVAEHTSADIEEQKEQLLQLQEREARLLSRIDTLSTKVRDVEGSGRNQWHMAEVEHLLRLANQRILTVSDVPGALELMASAEHILEQLDDYSLFPVREALAEDMAVLKATSILDQESIWLRLQATTELIPDLVILDDTLIADMASTLPSEPASPSHDGVEANPSADKTWQQTIKAVLVDTWHRFTSLFRINTQREQPIEALLTPEQDQLIRQMMLLLIEQSKLALMSGQPSIYQNSLKQASDWLHRYFMLGGDVSKQLAMELSELEKLSIMPQMPGIHRSLEALKEHQSSFTVSPAPPEEEDVSPTAPENKVEPDLPDEQEGEKNKPVTEPDQPADQGVQIS